MSKKKRYGKIGGYCLLVIVAVIMLYPLVWMLFASFKNNEEIFKWLIKLKLEGKAK